MKFNKSLFVSVALISLLASCSFSAKKPNSEKQETPDIKEAGISGADALSDFNGADASNFLPSGPVTPNPYVQNTQKVNEQVDVNFRDAVAAMQQKNWNHAETVLMSLAEKNPKLSGVYVNLGIVYRNKGEMEKAAQAFNRAINANNKNVDAYNQLAVLKREAGEFNAAEKLYQKALVIWPFYPEGHKNIAILYDLYLGKPESALPHYQAYQQLLPAPDKQVENWIADLQRRLDGGKKSNKTEAN